MSTKNKVKSIAEKVFCSVSTIWRKEDSDLPVTSAAVPEDIFSDLYFNGFNGGTIIKPPYDVGTLKSVVECSSAVQPCISAYVSNVASTGWCVTKDGVEIDPANIPPDAQHIFDLFNEISPGKSLTNLKEEVRVAKEETGNAYLEMVRNVNGDLMFVNILPESTMRLVKLGAPAPIRRAFKRFGKEILGTYLARERVYAQCVGADTIYFKEFRAYADVDKRTGERIDHTNAEFFGRGNEVKHLTLGKAANSPYGVPRWINQSPSVIGSRAAEENNLAYQESGGVHPFIAFIMGGTVGSKVKEQLENAMKRAKKFVGLVVDVAGTGGSTDKETRPDVKVEKFDSSSDSSFENYIEKGSDKVRMAFRLPKLFLGITEGYNFATAQVAYASTEAQVFLPERQNDEEWINEILEEIDKTGRFKYKSKPVVLKFAADQLKGLAMLATVDEIDKRSWVSAVNSVSGVDVHYEDPVPIEPGQDTEVADEQEIQKLASNWIMAIDGELDDKAAGVVFKFAKELSGDQKLLFDKSVTLKMFPAAHHDQPGAAAVSGCLCGAVH